MRPPTVLALYRHDFLSFVRFVFHELHPDKTFVEGWHIDLMADALMRCAPGGERRLIVNVPPRHLKSLCASIAWPLFILARHPGLRIVVCAGTRELAAEFQELRERLVKSRRLLKVFGSLRSERITGGFRFANGSELIQTIVGRSQIGRGADIIIVDDPISATHATHDRSCAVINTWYDTEVLPRLNNKRSAGVVVVMQRLAQNDLCGHLLRGSETWRHLCLSAVAKNDEKWVMRDGVSYRRRAGEVLCSQLEDRSVLLEQLAKLGGATFCAQYLQAPELAPDRTNYRRSRRPMVLVPPDWKYGDPKIYTQIFAKIAVADDIRHEYFGEPDLDSLDGLREQTEEEFDHDFYMQQTTLIAAVRADRARRETERGAPQ